MPSLAEWRHTACLPLFKLKVAVVGVQKPSPEESNAEANSVQQWCDRWFLNSCHCFRSTASPGYCLCFQHLCSNQQSCTLALGSHTPRCCKLRISRKLALQQRSDHYIIPSLNSMQTLHSTAAPPARCINNNSRGQLHPPQHSQLPLRSSTRMAAASQAAGRSLEAVLLDAGVPSSVLGTVQQVSSSVGGFTCVVQTARGADQPAPALLTSAPGEPASCFLQPTTCLLLPVPATHHTQRAPELSCISVQERVEPLLQFLQSLALQPEDLRVMLLRCPRLLSFSTQRQVLPVVMFLREDLHFDEQQVASVVKRFPGILG